MSGECEICSEHTLDCKGHKIKVSILADLHGEKPSLPGGDLLIIAGDFTRTDTLQQHSDVLNWIHKQDYRKKVIIAGNHDDFLKKNPNFYSKTKIEYLCDSGTEFEGWKIWGTPWSLWFPQINPKCSAFTSHDINLKEKYDLIPDDTDIIISHTPPYGILDQNYDGYLCGSRELRNALDRVKPKFCIFGHIHECGGKELMYKHQGPNTWCINASIMDKNYNSTQLPIHIEI